MRKGEREKLREEAVKGRKVRDLHSILLSFEETNLTMLVLI